MELITMMLGAVLVNNLVLSSFGGLDIVALGTKRKINACTLGLATCVVMTVSALINSLLAGVLVSLNATHLNTLVFVGVIVATSALVEKCTNLKLGRFVVLVMLNGAILTLALHNSELTVLQATLAGLASGVGFMFVLHLYISIRRTINDKYVPEAFKGLPIDMLTLAIMAMAFSCFK